MHHHHRAVLNAAKDSRKAQKKEKNLKRVALGLSGFLCIFAVIFLITQATHLSNSIEEAKVTYVYKISLCGKYMITLLLSNCYLIPNHLLYQSINADRSPLIPMDTNTFRERMEGI